MQLTDDKSGDSNQRANAKTNIPSEGNIAQSKPSGKAEIDALLKKIHSDARAWNTLNAKGREEHISDIRDFIAKTLANLDDDKEIFISSVPDDENPIRLDKDSAKEIELRLYGSPNSTVAIYFADDHVKDYGTEKNALAAIIKLGEAINRGDKNFIFPSDKELTAEAKIQSQAKRGAESLLDKIYRDGKNLDELTFDEIDSHEEDIAEFIQETLSDLDDGKQILVTPQAGGPCRDSGRPVPGSTAFVPAAAGLILAGEVVRDLLSARIRSRPVS